MPLPVKEHTEGDFQNLYSLVSQGIPPRLAYEYAGFDKADYKRDMEDGREDFLRSIDSPEAKAYQAVLDGRKALVTKTLSDILSNEKDSASKLKILAKFEKEDFGEDSEKKSSDDDKVVLVDSVPVDDEPKKVSAVNEIKDANDNRE